MSIVEYSLDCLNKQGGHAFTLLVNKMRNSFTVPDYSFVKVWKGVDVFTQEERTVVQTHHNSFFTSFVATSQITALSKFGKELM